MCMGNGKDFLWTADSDTQYIEGLRISGVRSYNVVLLIAAVARYFRLDFNYALSCKLDDVIVVV